MAQPAPHSPRGDAAETRPLARLIERLARAGQGGRGPEPGLAGLLREIDETVLPRQITLFEGDRAVAQLAVSNRRLMAFDPVEGPQRGDPAPPADPETAARLYARRLVDLFARHADLRFAVTGRNPRAAQGGIGASARALGALVGQSPGDDPGPGRLTDFAAALRPQARAWVEQGAGRRDSGGSGEQIAALQAALASGLMAGPAGGTGPGMAAGPGAKTGAGTGRVGPGRPHCLMLPLPDGLVLIGAEDYGHRFAALIPAAAAPAAMDHWHSLFAPIPTARG